MSAWWWHVDGSDDYEPEVHIKSTCVTFKKYYVMLFYVDVYILHHKYMNHYMSHTVYIYTHWAMSSNSFSQTFLFITAGFLASRTCMLPDSLGKSKDSKVDPEWTWGLRSILTWHDLNSPSWLVWKPWKGTIFGSVGILALAEASRLSK